MTRQTFAVIVLLFVIGGYARPMMGQQPPQQQPPQNPQTPITSVTGLPAAAAPGQPSTPAVVTTSVPSPASPSHAPEQVEWSLAMAYVIQWLKKQKWFPLISEATSPQAKAAFGAVVAAATAAGIHFAVSGSFLDGNGVSITFTGISADALKDIGFQWVSQQAWYDAFIRRIGTGGNV